MGKQGPPGLQGPPGGIGKRGLKGSKGHRGLIGLQGLLGSPGPPGEKGPFGSPGGRGDNGGPGPRGPNGIDGSMGDIGMMGIRGPRGPQGDIGKKGPTGDVGSPGPPGLPGESIGYSAASLSALLGQGTSKGPDPLNNDEPVRMFVPELNDEEQKELVVRAYKKLKSAFEEFQRPDGGKNAPAKTCKDLHMAHPQKPSGDYWIDPNGADPKDSILVHCDMDTESTCVSSKPLVSPAFKLSSQEDGKEVWLSERKSESGPYHINYKADSHQMSFLQLLSHKAVQNVTFHCKATLAYKNSRGTGKKSLSLMSWNDLEIKNRGKFKYEVLQDKCSDMAPAWASTVFQVDTDKPTRLPIVDVKVRDFGGPDQAFKVEAGQVCFS